VDQSWLVEVAKKHSILEKGETQKASKAIKDKDKDKEETERKEASEPQGQGQDPQGQGQAAPPRVKDKTPKDKDKTPKDDSGDGQEDSAAKQAKKHQDKQLATLRQLKNRMQASLSQADDYIKAIEEQAG